MEALLSFEATTVLPITSVIIHDGMTQLNIWVGRDIAGKCSATRPKRHPQMNPDPVYFNINLTQANSKYSLGTIHQPLCF